MRLYKRFKVLDKDNSGTISMEEFLSIPELAMNPLCPRIISVFSNTLDPWEAASDSSLQIGKSIGGKYFKDPKKTNGHLDELDKKSNSLTSMSGSGSKKFFNEASS